MRKWVFLAVLVTLATALLRPAGAQEPVTVAFANPQPHFVAAWAPTKEREAEGAAVLKQRAALELVGVTVDMALKTLTQTLGLRITYSPVVLPTDKRVTIRAQDVAVVTALTEVLFGSGLDVVVALDGSLALVRCEHTAPKVDAGLPDTGAIAGRVKDRATGEPIIGATVTVEGTQRTATTGSDGQFRIGQLPADTYTLRVQFIGYVPAPVRVTVAAMGVATVEVALEKAAQQLEELVTVTPGGTQAAVKALATPVTVITAERIAEQRPRTSQEIFRQAIPTAVSWDLPANPSSTFFSVRGATTLSGSSFMKVFIDGVEASAFRTTPVDPSSIQRVEVIRGPQAATLFGSDAIGGVVQIFTKHGAEAKPGAQFRAAAEAGLLETPYEGFGAVLRQRYTASVHGRTSDVSYNFGAGYSRTADYVPGGEISRQSAPTVYGGAHLGSGLVSADISGRYYTNNNPVVLNPLVATTGLSFLAKPNYQPTAFTNLTLGTRVVISPTRYWRNVVTVGVDQSSLDRVQVAPRLTTPADTLLSLFYSQQSKRSIGYNTSIQGDVARHISATLTAGIDHYSLPSTSINTPAAANSTGTITTVGAPPSVTRLIVNNTGYFAQGQLSVWERAFLTVGLRAEENTLFGDSIGTPLSPQAGLTYVQTVGATAVKFRASYGRAIRPPTAGQKSADVGPFQVQLANPLLGPERQHGWDAGMDVTINGRGTLGVTWYSQTASNLIQFVPIATTPLLTNQFQNVGRVRNVGIEVESGFDLKWMRLNAQYGYARARIDELGPNYDGDLRTNDQALATPKHTAGGSATFLALPRTALTVGITYVGGWRNYDNLALLSCFGGTGPCQASSRDYIVNYPGFAKVRVALSQDLGRSLTAFLSADNLLNNRAYEQSNIQPRLGRSTTVGLELHP